MELASKDSCTDCGNCRLEQISKLNNISAEKNVADALPV